MPISFAITCCTELNELKSLIPHLLKYKREEDEIVILYDCINGSKEVEEYLRSIEPGLTYTPIDKFNFRWYSYDFDGDFSKMKNFLIEMCKGGNTLFQLDADEIPNEHVLENLPLVLEMNPEVEMFLISRTNFVDGITDEYIKAWGWSKDEYNRVQWPDKQFRIFKNNGNIKYKNKVHEVLDGYTIVASLPEETEWSLLHHKTMDKQLKQNSLYNKLQS